jgi:hypothetical protein
MNEALEAHDVDARYRATMDEWRTARAEARAKAKAEAAALAQEFEAWVSGQMVEPLTLMQRTANWWGGWPLDRLPESIPPGLHLRHMGKGPPKRGFSLNTGNAVWLAKGVDSDHEPCPCGWARQFGTHYRMVRK